MKSGVGAGPGGKYLPNMPGLLAWNAWYGNPSLKTHQPHLLNFFWAKDHIFRVTVEKRWMKKHKENREREKKTKSEQNYLETGASSFQSNEH